MTVIITVKIVVKVESIPHAREVAADIQDLIRDYRSLHEFASIETRVEGSEHLEA